MSQIHEYILSHFSAVQTFSENMLIIKEKEEYPHVRNITTGTCSNVAALQPDAGCVCPAFMGYA